MKNFQSIEEIIDFAGTFYNDASELQITAITRIDEEFSRLKATHLVKNFAGSIYTIPIERFMVFQSADNYIMEIHLYIRPTNNLAELIKADLGDYYAGASWGIEEKANLDILSWNHGRFVVDLRKGLKNLDSNYTLLPPFDVITISNDSYRGLSIEEPR